MVIDLPGHRCPPPGDEGGQQMTDSARQGDDGGILEQIEQERPHRLRAVGTAQIEQDDGQFAAHRRSLSINAATCSGGVSGTMPWPRLKMKGTPLVTSRIWSTARSSAAPPLTSRIGSRLPCRVKRGDSFSTAQDNFCEESRLMPSTPVSLA